jgi:hypothetical protein
MKRSNIHEVYRPVKPIIFLFIVACCIHAPLYAQSRTLSIDSVTIRTVAQKKLSEFTSSLTKENAQLFGFTGVNMQDLGVGESFETYTIRLDRLKEFNITSDPMTLLVNDRRIASVVIDKQNQRTVNMLTFEIAGGDLNFKGFEGSNTSKGIMTAIDLVKKAPNALNTKILIIRVLFLSLDFAGYRDNSGILFLAPSYSYPNSEIQAGKIYPAKTIVAELKSLAAKYNGLPR